MSACRSRICSCVFEHESQTRLGKRDGGLLVIFLRPGSEVLGGVGPGDESLLWTIKLRAADHARMLCVSVAAYVELSQKTLGR